MVADTQNPWSKNGKKYQIEFNRYRDDVGIMNYNIGFIIV